MKTEIRSPEHCRQQRQDCVLAIDGSWSMAERDYLPTRLAAAKNGGAQYVKRRAQLCPLDRVAVVSFSDRAIRQCGLLPLNTSQGRVIKAIDRIQPDAATAIGKGLRKAERLLLSEDDASAAGVWRWLLGDEAPVSPNALKRVVCLTDGDHNKGRNPRPIAERLKQAGVLIDCIGIGGDPSCVNEALLRQLASRDDLNGGVRYRFIDDAAQLQEHFRQLATRITR